MLIGFLTALTMIAFAANSVLCRIALGGGLIDPVSFMILRLVSGASFLLVVAQSRSQPIGPKARKIGGSWASGIALFAYAAAFSLAYVTLQTGTGALILFGSVQATMIGAGLRSGERPHPAQWLGLGVAVIGLVYLVFPGIEAPGILGALLMSISGISWGVYSLRGANEEAPLLSTSGNFIRALPMALLLSTIAASTLHADFSGVVLAVISGALTSGLGYVLWYRALRGLTTTRAAIVQLVVPILAALGGIVFMGELVTTRFVVATALVLGGVAVALLGRVSKCGVSEPQERATEAHAGDGGQA